MITLSIISNILIIIIESILLFHIKNKKDIFKYYTYLQNLIALIISIIYTVFIIVFLIINTEILEFIKGLRYISTCGLLSTAFIFTMFLSSNSDNTMTKDDFNNFSPKIANILLHYVVPILSTISFLVFEKDISLNNEIWTIIVAIPSCLYWICYIVLTSTTKWEEPYKFNKNKNNLLDILISILIPISFIIISIILWEIK